MTNLRFCRALSKRTLLLLAPPDANLQFFTGGVNQSASRHGNLLKRIQQLRGRIYSEDGAIDEATLDSEGRHVSDVDASSWHLVTVNEHDDVLGCTRFRQHGLTAGFHDLCLRDSAIAKCAIWGGRLRASVSADIMAAQRLGFAYVEVGGWALSHELRNTSEALQSVLATFAWSQVIGGALGVSTATERNGSAAILKRLGGTPMRWDGCALPPYFDHQYGCGMEVLRFDSRAPSARYGGAIEELRRLIATLEVIQGNGEELSPVAPYAEPQRMPYTWADPLPVAC